MYRTVLLDRVLFDLRGDPAQPARRGIFRLVHNILDANLRPCHGSGPEREQRSPEPGSGGKTVDDAGAGVVRD